MAGTMHAENGYDNNTTVDNYYRDWFPNGFANFAPQDQSNYSTYTERRTYGRDQDGEYVVTIDKNPNEKVAPVRPVTPVRPFESPYYHRPVEGSRSQPTPQRAIETDDERSQRRRSSQFNADDGHRQPHANRHTNRRRESQPNTMEKQRSQSYSGGMHYLTPTADYPSSRRHVAADNSRQRAPRSVNYDDELAVVFFNPAYKD